MHNERDGKRCNGAPDFIIEIVSPGNPSDDYIRKLYYYKNYGVREYWIVDPRKKTVTINYFESDWIFIISASVITQYLSFYTARKQSRLPPQDILHRYRSALHPAHCPQ